MFAKLMVLAAALAIAWAFFKLLGKIGQQSKELDQRREAEAERKQEIVKKREANIIDLEEDPKTGEFRERD